MSCSTLQAARPFDAPPVLHWVDTGPVSRDGGSARPLSSECVMTVNRKRSRGRDRKLFCKSHGELQATVLSECSPGSLLRECSTSQQFTVEPLVVSGKREGGFFGPQQQYASAWQLQDLSHEQLSEDPLLRCARHCATACCEPSIQANSEGDWEDASPKPALAAVTAPEGVKSLCCMEPLSIPSTAVGGVETTVASFDGQKNRPPISPSFTVRLDVKGQPRRLCPAHMLCVRHRARRSGTVRESLESGRKNRKVLTAMEPVEPWEDFTALSSEAQLEINSPKRNEDTGAELFPHWLFRAPPIEMPVACRVKWRRCVKKVFCISALRDRKRGGGLCSSCCGVCTSVVLRRREIRLKRTLPEAEECCDKTCGTKSGVTPIHTAQNLDVPHTCDLPIVSSTTRARSESATSTFWSSSCSSFLADTSSCSDETFGNDCFRDVDDGAEASFGAASGSRRNKKDSARGFAFNSPPAFLHGCFFSTSLRSRVRWWKMLILMRGLPQARPRASLICCKMLTKKVAHRASHSSFERRGHTAFKSLCTNTEAFVFKENAKRLSYGSSGVLVRPCQAEASIVGCRAFDNKSLSHGQKTDGVIQRHPHQPDSVAPKVWWQTVTNRAKNMMASIRQSTGAFPSSLLPSPASFHPFSCENNLSVPVSGSVLSCSSSSSASSSSSSSGSANASCDSAQTGSGTHGSGANNTVNLTSTFSSSSSSSSCNGGGCGGEEPNNNRDNEFRRNSETHDFGSPISKKAQQRQLQAQQQPQSQLLQHQQQQMRVKVRSTAATAQQPAGHSSSPPNSSATQLTDQQQQQQPVVVEFPVRHFWKVAKQQNDIESSEVGRCRGFYYRLLIHPKGTAGTDSEASHLSVFLEAVRQDWFPEDWVFPNVRFELTVVNFRDPKQNVTSWAHWSFSNDATSRGWQKMLSHSRLNRISGFMDEDGTVLVRGKAEPPYPGLWSRVPRYRPLHLWSLAPQLSGPIAPLPSSGEPNGDPQTDTALSQKSQKPLHKQSQQRCDQESSSSSLSQRPQLINVPSALHQEDGGDIHGVQLSDTEVVDSRNSCATTVAALPSVSSQKVLSQSGKGIAGMCSGVTQASANKQSSSVVVNTTPLLPSILEKGVVAATPEENSERHEVDACSLTDEALASSLSTVGECSTKTATLTSNVSQIPAVMCGLDQFQHAALRACEHLIPSVKTVLHADYVTCFIVILYHLREFRREILLWSTSLMTPAALPRASVRSSLSPGQDDDKEFAGLPGITDEEYINGSDNNIGDVYDDKRNDGGGHGLFTDYSDEGCSIIAALQSVFSEMQLWPLAVTAARCSRTPPLRGNCIEQSCSTSSPEHSHSSYPSADWVKEQLLCASAAFTLKPSFPGVDNGRVGIPDWRISRHTGDGEVQSSSHQSISYPNNLPSQPSIKNVVRVLGLYDVQKMDVTDPLPLLHSELFSRLHRECQISYVSHVYKQALLQARRQRIEGTVSSEVRKTAPADICQDTAATAQRAPSASEDHIDDTCDAQELDHVLRVLFSTTTANTSREPLSSGEYATSFLRAKHVHSMYRALEQSGKKLKRLPEVLFIYLSPQRNTKKGELFDVPLRLEMSNMLLHTTGNKPYNEDGAAGPDGQQQTQAHSQLKSVFVESRFALDERKKERDRRHNKRRVRKNKARSHILRPPPNITSAGGNMQSAFQEPQRSDLDDEVLFLNEDPDDGFGSRRSSSQASDDDCCGARGTDDQSRVSRHRYQNRITRTSVGHNAKSSVASPSRGANNDGPPQVQPCRSDKWYCLYALIIREGDGGGSGAVSQATHSLLLRPEEDGPWFRIAHDRVEKLTPKVDFSEWKCHRDFFCAAAVYMAEDYIDAIANGDVDLEGDIRSLNPDLYQRTLQKLGVTEKKLLYNFRAGFHCERLGTVERAVDDNATEIVRTNDLPPRHTAVYPHCAAERRSTTIPEFWDVSQHNQQKHFTCSSASPSNPNGGVVDPPSQGAADNHKYHELKFAPKGAPLREAASNFILGTPPKNGLPDSMSAANKSSEIDLCRDAFESYASNAASSSDLTHIVNAPPSGVDTTQPDARKLQDRHPHLHQNTTNSDLASYTKKSLLTFPSSDVWIPRSAAYDIQDRAAEKPSSVDDSRLFFPCCPRSLGCFRGHAVASYLPPAVASLEQARHHQLYQAHLTEAIRRHDATAIKRILTELVAECLSLVCSNFTMQSSPLKAMPGQHMVKRPSVLEEKNIHASTDGVMNLTAVSSQPVGVDNTSIQSLLPASHNDLKPRGVDESVSSTLWTYTSKEPVNTGDLPHSPRQSARHPMSGEEEVSRLAEGSSSATRHSTAHPYFAKDRSLLTTAIFNEIKGCLVKHLDPLSNLLLLVRKDVNIYCLMHKRGQLKTSEKTGPGQHQNRVLMNHGVEQYVDTWLERVWSSAAKLVDEARLCLATHLTELNSFLPLGDLYVQGDGTLQDIAHHEDTKKSYTVEDRGIVPLDKSLQKCLLFGLSCTSEDKIADFSGSLGGFTEPCGRHTGNGKSRSQPVHSQSSNCPQSECNCQDASQVASNSTDLQHKKAIGEPCLNSANIGHLHSPANSLEESAMMTLEYSRLTVPDIVCSAVALVIEERSMAEWSMLQKKHLWQLHDDPAISASVSTPVRAGVAGLSPGSSSSVGLPPSYTHEGNTVHTVSDRPGEKQKQENGVPCAGKRQRAEAHVDQCLYDDDKNDVQLSYAFSLGKNSGVHPNTSSMTPPVCTPLNGAKPSRSDRPPILNAPPAATHKKGVAGSTTRNSLRGVAHSSPSLSGANPFAIQPPFFSKLPSRHGSKATANINPCVQRCDVKVAFPSTVSLESSCPSTSRKVFNNSIFSKTDSHHYPTSIDGGSALVLSDGGGPIPQLSETSKALDINKEADLVKNFKGFDAISPSVPQCSATEYTSPPTEEPLEKNKHFAITKQDEIIRSQHPEQQYTHQLSIDQDFAHSVDPDDFIATPIAKGLHQTRLANFGSSCAAFEQAMTGNASTPYPGYMCLPGLSSVGSGTDSLKSLRGLDTLLGSVGLSAGLKQLVTATRYIRISVVLESDLCGLEGFACEQEPPVRRILTASRGMPTSHLYGVMRLFLLRHSQKLEEPRHSGTSPSTAVAGRIFAPGRSHTSPPSNSTTKEQTLNAPSRKSGLDPRHKSRPLSLTPSTETDTKGGQRLPVSSPSRKGIAKGCQPQGPHLETSWKAQTPLDCFMLYALVPDPDPSRKGRSRYIYITPDESIDTYCDAKRRQIDPEAPDVILLLIMCGYSILPQQHHHKGLGGTTGIGSAANISTSVTGGPHNGQHPAPPPPPLSKRQQKLAQSNLNQKHATPILTFPLTDDSQLPLLIFKWFSFESLDLICLGVRVCDARKRLEDYILDWLLPLAKEKGYCNVGLGQHTNHSIQPVVVDRVGTSRTGALSSSSPREDISQYVVVEECHIRACQNVRRFNAAIKKINKRTGDVIIVQPKCGLTSPTSSMEHLEATILNRLSHNTFTRLMDKPLPHSKTTSGKNETSVFRGPSSSSLLAHRVSAAMAFVEGTSSTNAETLNGGQGIRTLLLNHSKVLHSDKNIVGASSNSSNISASLSDTEDGGHPRLPGSSLTAATRTCKARMDVERGTSGADNDDPPAASSSLVIPCTVMERMGVPSSSTAKGSSLLLHNAQFSKTTPGSGSGVASSTGITSSSGTKRKKKAAIKTSIPANTKSKIKAQLYQERRKVVADSRSTQKIDTFDVPLNGNNPFLNKESFDNLRSLTTDVPLASEGCSRTTKSGTEYQWSKASAPKRADASEKDSVSSGACPSPSRLQPDDRARQEAEPAVSAKLTSLSETVTEAGHPAESISRSEATGTRHRQSTSLEYKPSSNLLHTSTSVAVKCGEVSTAEGHTNRTEDQIITRPFEKRVMVSDVVSGDSETMRLTDQKVLPPSESQQLAFSSHNAEEKYTLDLDTNTVATNASFLLPPLETHLPSTSDKTNNFSTSLLTTTPIPFFAETVLTTFPEAFADVIRHHCSFYDEEEQTQGSLALSTPATTEGGTPPFATDSTATSKKRKGGLEGLKVLLKPTSDVTTFVTEIIDAALNEIQRVPLGVRLASPALLSNGTSTLLARKVVTKKRQPQSPGGVWISRTASSTAYHIDRLFSDYLRDDKQHQQAIVAEFRKRLDFTIVSSPVVSHQQQSSSATSQNSITIPKLHLTGNQQNAFAPMATDAPGASIIPSPPSNVVPVDELDFLANEADLFDQLLSSRQTAALELFAALFLTSDLIGTRKGLHALTMALLGDSQALTTLLTLPGGTGSATNTAIVGSGSSTGGTSNTGTGTSTLSVWNNSLLCLSALRRGFSMNLNLRSLLSAADETAASTVSHYCISLSSLSFLFFLLGSKHVVELADSQAGRRYFATIMTKLSDWLRRLSMVAFVPLDSEGATCSNIASSVSSADGISPCKRRRRRQLQQQFRLAYWALVLILKDFVSNRSPIVATIVSRETEAALALATLPFTAPYAAATSTSYLGQDRSYLGTPSGRTRLHVSSCGSRTGNADDRATTSIIISSGQPILRRMTAEGRRKASWAAMAQIFTSTTHSGSLGSGAGSGAEQHSSGSHHKRSSTAAFVNHHHHHLRRTQSHPTGEDASSGSASAATGRVAAGEPTTHTNYVSSSASYRHCGSRAKSKSGAPLSSDDAPCHSDDALDEYDQEDEDGGVQCYREVLLAEDDDEEDEDIDDELLPDDEADEDAEDEATETTDLLLPIGEGGDDEDDYDGDVNVSSGTVIVGLDDSRHQHFGTKSTRRRRLVCRGGVGRSSASPEPSPYMDAPSGSASASASGCWTQGRSRSKAFRRSDLEPLLDTQATLPISHLHPFPVSSVVVRSVNNSKRTTATAVLSVSSSTNRTARLSDMRMFLDRRTGRPRVSKDSPRIVHASPTWFVTYKPAFWHCSGPSHCVDRPLDLQRLRQGDIESTLKHITTAELQHSGKMESFHLWLMKQFPQQETIRRWAELECGLCHRIDLETSGAVLIARTRRTRDFLWDQFRRRNVHKEYLLLCHGRIRNRFGVVKTRLLTKDYDSRARIKSHFTQVVEEGGEDSLTEYHLCRVYRRKKWSDIIKHLSDSPPNVGEYVLPLPPSAVAGGDAATPLPPSAAGGAIPASTLSLQAAATGSLPSTSLPVPSSSSSAILVGNSEKSSTNHSGRGKIGLSDVPGGAPIATNSSPCKDIPPSTNTPANKKSSPAHQGPGGKLLVKKSETVSSTGGEEKSFPSSSSSSCSSSTQVAAASPTFLRGRMFIDPGLNGKHTENDEFSLCKCRIVTGRTHQIRVHMKHIGHPLVSDTKYLEPKKCQEDRQWCPRMFLHAAVLEFADPDSPNTYIEAVCPLAHELLQALDTALVCVDDYEPISMQQYGMPVNLQEPQQHNHPSHHPQPVGQETTLNAQLPGSSASIGVAASQATGGQENQAAATAPSPPSTSMNPACHAQAILNTRTNNNDASLDEISTSCNPKQVIGDTVVGSPDAVDGSKTPTLVAIPPDSGDAASDDPTVTLEKSAVISSLSPVSCGTSSSPTSLASSLLTARHPTGAVRALKNKNPCSSIEPAPPPMPNGTTSAPPPSSVAIRPK